ncbi:MAG: hypothetical protein JSS02_17975, partial [Planctomycetes bacterium]|nr:hypothetical protein [Planctomycetota bacterium]
MGNGWNWQVREWPYLVFGSNSLITIMGQMQNVLWFDLVGSTYVPRFNVRDALQLDSVNNVYVWTQLDGTVTKFSSVNGAFISRTEVGGTVTAVYSRNLANVNTTEVRRTATSGSTTTIESFLYSYDNVAGPLPNLTNVLLRRSTNGGSTWTNVAQATYTYYAKADVYGTDGDLQTVTTANWNGSAWENTGTTLYRYVPQPSASSSSSSSSSSGSSGFIPPPPPPPPPPPYTPPKHLLQYVVLPASYVQLAAVTNPLTAGNDIVMQFADYYYYYDSNNRVISETVKQASQSYGFASVPSSNP